MTEKQCLYCKKPIPKLGHNRGTKYCSAKCSSMNYKQSYMKSSGHNGLSSGTVGAMNELVVAADLMQKGYNVFRALSPSCPYDLIVGRGDCIKRVEVTTGQVNMKTNHISHARKDNTKSDIVAVVIGKTIIYKPEVE